MSPLGPTSCPTPGGHGAWAAGTTGPRRFQPSLRVAVTMWGHTSLHPRLGRSLLFHGGREWLAQRTEAPTRRPPCPHLLCSGRGPSCEQQLRVLEQGAPALGGAQPPTARRTGTRSRDPAPAHPSPINQYGHFLPWEAEGATLGRSGWVGRVRHCPSPGSDTQRSGPAPLPPTATSWTPQHLPRIFIQV